jgi:hypothetical protein
MKNPFKKYGSVHQGRLNKKDDWYVLQRFDCEIVGMHVLDGKLIVATKNAIYRLQEEV